MIHTVDQLIPVASLEVHVTLIDLDVIVMQIVLQEIHALDMKDFAEVQSLDALLILNVLEGMCVRDGQGNVGRTALVALMMMIVRHLTSVIFIQGIVVW